MYAKVMMYNIRSGAVRWQIHDNLMTIVTFALSLTIYEIFAKQEKMPSFTLKMKVNFIQ